MNQPIYSESNANPILANSGSINLNNNLANNAYSQQSLHEMKQTVKDALCGSRTFYISMHVLTIGMMTLYDNDIKESIQKDDYLCPFIYITLVLLSGYFFWTCGKNPGYAPYDSDDIEMQNTQFREPSSTGIQNNEDTQMRNNLDDEDHFDGHSDKSQHSSIKYKNLIPQNSLALGGSIDQQGSNEDERKSNSNQYQNEDYVEICDKQNKIDQNFTRFNTKIGKRHSDVVYTSNQYQQTHIMGGSANQNYHPIHNQDEDGFLPNTKHSSGPRNHSASELSQDIRQDFPQEINSLRTSGTNSQRESSNTNESDQNEQLDAVAMLFYCHICKRHQPFRSKHCDDCGRCICKFDHHCFWIGGCVGELNHRKFWTFLTLQTIVIGWTFITSLNALDRYTYTDENGSESYSQEYGAFAVLSFVLFVLLLFTGVLSFYHTFLIISNQTTWEHVKKSKISYISKMPKGFYPFNQGFCQNIKLTFFHNNQLRDWKVPTLREALVKHQNTINIFENEYYNCC